MRRFRFCIPCIIDKPDDGTFEVIRNQILGKSPSDGEMEKVRKYFQNIRRSEDSLGMKTGKSDIIN